MTYTAILKAKEGELNALSKGGLPSGTRVLLEHNSTPIGDRAMKRWIEALSQTQMLAWGLDLSAHRRPNGSTFRKILDDLPAAERTKVSGVITPTSHGTLRQAACNQAQQSDLVLLRIPVRQPGLDYRSHILSFADSLPVERDKQAIVLDFGNLGSLTGPALRSKILEVAAPILDDGGFESVTTSGTSFPDRIGGFPVGWRMESRPEFEEWRNAVMSTGSLICYGDYGPRSADFPPGGFANTLAQVRYTCPSGYYIFRGGLLRNDHEQLRTIGSDLATSQHFMGVGFSWGDGEVERIGSGQGGTGNRTTWIAIETSHHLAFTSEQVWTSLGL